MDIVRPPKDDKRENKPKQLLGAMGNNRFNRIEDSPVERWRKELPRGKGDWAGFDVVYRKIASACERMGQEPYCCCGAEHVNAMAILGCGDEETMKYEQMRLRMRGFLID